MAQIGNAGENRMGPKLMHPVPSNLRNLQGASVHRRRKAPDFAGNHAQAARVVFFAVIHQNLDPDTNAQKRLARADYVVAQHPRQSQPMQVVHGRAGGADSRQNHAVGRADLLGPVGDLTSMAQMFQGARDAGQVAGPVIHDCYHLAFTRDYQTYHADVTECRGVAQ